MKSYLNVSYKLFLYISVVIVILAFFSCSTHINFIMPGSSFNGELPLLSSKQEDIKKQLYQHVYKFSNDIGMRNMDNYRGMLDAADYIDAEFTKMGYTIIRQEYLVDNKIATNIIAEKKGTTKQDEIVVIGAHYDSLEYTVGANDNASGVAGMLVIANEFRTMKFSRTVRFVAFANEEPPYFKQETMGSYVYAKSCRAENANIIAMFSLESIGSYSNDASTQNYPVFLNLFYPDSGNFIAFISNSDSRHVLYRTIRMFRETSKFPSEGLIAPAKLPGVDWSDHMSFWNVGYKAVMITDTATYRDRNYHTYSDTIEHIDFESTARVVSGLRDVFLELLE